MSYIDDLEQAADEALAASSSATDSAQIMADVANGDENTTVTTANGEVKTLAKAIKDIIDSIEAGVEAPQVEPQTLSAGQTTVTLSTMTTEGIAVYVEGSREFDFTVVNSTDFEFGESFPDGTRIWVVKRDIEGVADSFTVNTSTGSQTLSNALDQRVIYVDTIDDLQALPTSGLMDGQEAYVKGTHFEWSGVEWVPTGPVSIRTYGAVGDGADDTAAINNALSDLPAGGVLIIPKGTFTVTPSATNAYILELPNVPRISIIGESRTSSVIKVADSSGNYRGVFGSSTADSIEFLTFNNFTIDHNQANNGFATAGEYSSSGRYSISTYPSPSTGDDFVIEGMDFINCDSVVSLYFPMDETWPRSIKITDNRWLALDNNLKQDYDQSIVNAACDGLTVSDNIFQGKTFGGGSPRTAIETHASNQVITGNNITKMQVGINATGASRAGTNYNIIISGNNIDVGYDAIMYWSFWQDEDIIHEVGLDGISINSNQIRVRPNEATYGKANARGIFLYNQGRTIPIKNIKISENQVIYPEDPSYYSANSMLGNGVGIGWYMSLFQEGGIHDAIVEDNTVTNCPAQGLLFEYGNVSSLTLKGNTLINCCINDKTSRSVYEDHLVLLAASFNDKVLVTGNHFVLKGSSGPDAIYYVRDRSANKSMVEIKHNSYGLPATPPSYFTQLKNNAFRTASRILIDESIRYSREEMGYPEIDNEGAGRIVCLNNDAVYHPMPGDKRFWIARYNVTDVTGLPGESGDIAYMQPQTQGSPISYHYDGTSWVAGPTL